MGGNPSPIRGSGADAKPSTRTLNRSSETVSRATGSGSNVIPLELDPRYAGVKMATQDDLVDAKIAAAEARTETKVARIEGKLDLVLSKLGDVRDGQRSVVANIWVVFAALAAIIIGSIAAAPVIFDLGMKLRETITNEIQQRLPTPTPGVPPRR